MPSYLPPGPDLVRGLVQAPVLPSSLASKLHAVQTRTLCPPGLGLPVTLAQTHPCCSFSITFAGPTHGLFNQCPRELQRRYPLESYQNSGRKTK